MGELYISSSSKSKLLNVKRKVVQAISEARSLYSKIATNPPRIVKAFIDTETNVLYIIVEDRPDKAAIIGHGGIITANVRRLLKVPDINIQAKTDLYLKRMRIKAALKVLEDVASKNYSENITLFLEHYMKPLLESELRFPPRKIPQIAMEHKPQCIVAFSGGVDSFVSMVILKKLGVDFKAVTVDPGRMVITPDIREMIMTLCKTLEVEHAFIEAPEIREVLVRASRHGFSPCGQCTDLMFKKILDYASKMGTDIIVFGNLLPTGIQSMSMVDGILRVNLPGALAMTKKDILLMARSNGHPLKYVFSYGCPFLNALFRKYPSTIYASFDRILRKVRAGIMEPGFALKLMKGILKASIKGA
ncbi:hypothetical protein DRO02_05245 [archaeon]|nr:MAG: hypothetical protein DRO02_05245 [archaeon]HDM23427.1 hypothetical protein [Candidatus Bathyarchaeota archaeon]